MAYLLSLIQGWFYKLINFVFGKTKIFITILAWFLIITGEIFLSRPKKARDKLLGLGFGWFKGPLLVLVVYLGMLLLSLIGKAHLTTREKYGMLSCAL